MDAAPRLSRQQYSRGPHRAGGPGQLAARRGYQLVYSAGWALTGREKAALRLVPEQAWQAAIDSRGKVRERPRR